MSEIASGALMDRIYRRQRHVYDFSRRFYLLGRDRLIEDLAPPPDGRVLEIGCGTARNLVAAARRYPEARLFGLDISAEMLLTARRVIEREGLSRHIRLARADATQFDPAILFGVPCFSRVFISCSLSMMPRWKRVLGQALAWTQPGGEVHIVDFGRQERLPPWFRQGLRHWLSLFHVTPRDGLEAALQRQGGRTATIQRFERPYRGYAQYAICRRTG